MTNYKKGPGSILREARESTGLAVRKVAEELGQAESSVYQIENGRAVISTKRIGDYLDALERAYSKAQALANAKPGETGIELYKLRLPHRDEYYQRAIDEKRREQREKSDIHDLYKQAAKDRAYTLDQIIEGEISAIYDGEPLLEDELKAARRAIIDRRHEKRARGL